MIMRESELKAILKFAGDLFTEITGAQLTLIGDRIGKLDKLSVETALKNHRAQHKFFEFPAFFEGLRIEVQRSRDRVKTHREQRIGEWLVQQPQYHGLKVHEAITRHFNLAWELTRKEDAEVNASQIVRRMIRGHCRRALLEIGWDAANADDLANECVGLKPGETIVTRRILRDVAEVMVVPALVEAGA
jgi:hypothetical protein